jgi:hypothetical protein
VIESLSKLGLSGGLGFLIGLGAVWWIEPTTPGGTAFLILVCVVTMMVLGAIVSKLFKRKEIPEILVEDKLNVESTEDRG